MRQFLDQGLHRIKYLSLQQRKPRIVALGTSRVMQFRDVMFGQSGSMFYNAGGMIQNLDDLQQFVDKIQELPSIRVVILGIEYWWLNDRWRETIGKVSYFNDKIQHDDALDGFAHANVLQQFLRSGLREDLARPTFYTLIGAWQGESAPVMHRWGFLARNRGKGFRSDGSFEYGQLKPTDWRFKDRENPPIMERIRNGNREFISMRSLSDKRMHQLLVCLRKLKESGINVICFSPPYPQDVVMELTINTDHKHAWQQYTDQLPEKIQLEGIPFVSAYATHLIGMNDSSMFDGFHALETFHLRLVQIMTEGLGNKNILGVDAKRIRTLLQSPRTNPWFPDYNAYQNPTV